MNERAATVADFEPRSRLARNWTIFSALLIIAAWFARMPLLQVAGMVELAYEPNPYFIPRHALLLHVTTPMASVIVSAFFMLPGVTLALMASRGRSMVHLTLAGFALSMVTICGAAIIWHHVAGTVLKGTGFFLLVSALTLLSLIWLNLRARHAGKIFTPAPHWRQDVAWALILAFAMPALFTAKLYWENLTADGAGVLNFIKVFVHTDWPFWPEDSGPIKVAPGVTSFLFDLPGSWFQRLLGEDDLVTRLPFVLYLGLLYVVVLGLIRLGRQAAIGNVDHFLIAAALMVYVLGLTFSGGYHPYFADTPMPAARETMVMTLYFGFSYFVFNGRMGSALWVGILAYMSLPSAGLWMLLILIGMFVAWTPRDWPRMWRLFAILVVAAAIGVLGPVVIRTLDMPVPGSEFSAKSIVNRLRFITFIEPQRWLWLTVPMGILPALSMIFWRHQDRVARVLVVATMLFFLFFYFQGYRVLPHHLIPAMFPPLVVMWRYGWLQDPSRFWPSRTAILAGIVAAVWLSFPNSTRLHVFSREFGHQIDLRGDHFEGYKTISGETFHHIFERVFPHQYTDATVAANYHGGPMAWLHYASEPKAEGQPITYLLQPDNDPVPTEAVALDKENGYTLFALDMAAHERNLNMTFPHTYSAPIYHLPREKIFGKGTRSGARTVIDLVAIARNVFGVPF